MSFLSTRATQYEKNIKYSIIMLFLLNFDVSWIKQKWLFYLLVINCRLDQNENFLNKNCPHVHCPKKNYFNNVSICYIEIILQHIVLLYCVYLKQKLNIVLQSIVREATGTSTYWMGNIHTCSPHVFLSLLLSNLLQ